MRRNTHTCIVCTHRTVSLHQLGCGVHTFSNRMHTWDSPSGIQLSMQTRLPNRANELSPDRTAVLTVSLLGISIQEKSTTVDYNFEVA